MTLPADLFFRPKAICNRLASNRPVTGPDKTRFILFIFRTTIYPAMILMMSIVENINGMFF